MPDIDTSFYPKAPQNNLIEMLGQVQQLKNAQQQNQLMQTENQRQNVGLSQDQVSLAHQQYGILSHSLASLASDPRTPTDAGHELGVQTAQQLLKDGIITPEIYQSEIANMPKNPVELPRYYQNLALRVLDSGSQFKQIYGEPGTLDDGTTVQPVTSSAITGIRPIAAPFKHTLTPAQRSDLIETKNAQGQTVMVPRGNILTQAGMNPLTADPATSLGNPANQLMPIQGQAPIMSAQGGGVVVSPPAGQIEAQQAMAKSGAEKYSTDLQREANFQGDMLPLQKAYEGMKQLGPTGTGPGKEQINDVRNFLISQGLTAPSDDAKVFDEIRKYTNQIALNSGNAGSDNRLAAAFAGNPSTSINNAASQDVLKSMVSLRRMQNAQVRSFQSSGQDATRYNQNAAEFNAAHDPVAFGIDMMTPEQGAKYYDSLSSGGKAKFRASVQTAAQLGLISPPSATQNGG